MTSQGTAHGRFQRAIHSRNVFQAELAIRELGRLSLLDARARNDFRGGVEVPMNEDDALRFLEKRRTFSFEGISGGEKDMWEVVRYGRRGYYMRGDE
jgi:hypothetical protein